MQASIFPSFGKGLVQQIFDLDKGSLKITISKWLTPSGKSINKEGISPDIKIEDLKKLSPDALILSGSPYSVYEKKW